MYVFVWSATVWRLLRAVYNGREIDSEQNCHVHTQRQLVATRGSSNRCVLQRGMLGAENTTSKSHRVYISVSLYQLHIVGNTLSISCRCVGANAVSSSQRVDSTVPIGVDAKGFNWQTAGYWAQKRAAKGHLEPFIIRYGV
jgi:hypothetical protein